MTFTMNAVCRLCLIFLFFVTAYTSAQTLTILGGLTDLYPTFSPDIERYYVILDEEASSLEVDAKSPEGAQWRFNGEPLTNSRISPKAGDTLAFELDDSAQRRYSVILLPSDFPRLEVKTRTHAVTPGYAFITPNINPGPAYRAVVDNYGVPIWYEQGRSYDFKRHPNGQYSYAYLTGETNQYGRADYGIALLDENLELIRRYQTLNLSHTDNHDFLLLENGSTVFLAYAGALRDLTAFGGAVDDLVEDTIVQEVDAEGEVVFQWNSWSDIKYDERFRSDLQDYAHGNALFLEPDEASYLISLRSTSQVIKVDRNTGELIWTLGGRSSDFTFPNEDDVFCGQHTPSRLANGNLLLFDNGQFCPPDGAERGTTRIAEYKLDETEMTAELVWSYAPETPYSIAQGSAQRLENGHTFIGWGMGTREPVIIGPEVLASEVDAQGNVVWELTAFFDVPVEEGSSELKAQPANSYRAWRFPVETLP